MKVQTAAKGMVLTRSPKREECISHVYFAGVETVCCASVCVKKRDEADPGNVARDVRTWMGKMACVHVHL